ncbi:MAG: hypothetical protein LUB59_07045 [Candidatus Gastranaerophilales bacterium]|nr:hypothetical protein [Candidatus Gastranaerophilales bacterium]
MAEYYVGMSLSPASTIETGVVVLDENNTLILVDKLFSMSDVQFFFDNFSSVKNSKICISLPWDNTLMTGKWRILSKPYQLVTTHTGFLNTENWLQRYSNRGCDCINKLIATGADVKRFDLYLSRLKLNLYSNFKQRSPADCKFLQNILKNEFGFSDIPTNMMPAGALEAIVGSLIARAYSKGRTEVISEFNGVDVINLK